MKLTDFDFTLPKELIAQAPAQPRDHARLLIYDRKTTKIIDDYFYNLDKHLLPGTTLTLNDSKVEKSRLRFGSTEIFVLQTVDPYTVKALVRPGKRFRTGMHAGIQIGLHKLKVETLSVDPEGIRVLKLSRPVDDPLLDKYRLTPLPPYIAQDENLSEEYQTVYAEPLGSKAAPTAGLHFTPEQLRNLGKNHPIAKLTLHVGLGTFAPVKTDDIGSHKMHSEDYFLSKEAAEVLNGAKSITAVGTTSLRVLESVGPNFKEASGSTDIFITPGYKFKAVDSLITNFHLPKSTLLMLVAALMGSVDEMQRVYAHAIAEQYRFYSFGDAMLIL
ncbi:MAG: S-adenosylmethionine--tRNA ribosyltransferase-isomerase [Candidatus Saccharibacteria bacterium]|nr:S-adenosylmethionine--tRNA ribosyltransferase-isomerase [Candidatus Saccharibacteria bacterium]